MASKANPTAKKPSKNGGNHLRGGGIDPQQEKRYGLKKGGGNQPYLKSTIIVDKMLFQSVGKKALENATHGNSFLTTIAGENTNITPKCDGKLELNEDDILCSYSFQNPKMAFDLNKDIQIQPAEGKSLMTHYFDTIKTPKITNRFNPAIKENCIAYLTKYFKNVISLLPNENISNLIFNTKGNLFNSTGNDNLTFYMINPHVTLGMIVEQYTYSILSTIPNLEPNFNDYCLKSSDFEDGTVKALFEKLISSKCTPLSNNTRTLYANFVIEVGTEGNRKAIKLMNLDDTVINVCTNFSQTSEIKIEYPNQYLVDPSSGVTITHSAPNPENTGPVYSFTLNNKNESIDKDYQKFFQKHGIYVGKVGYMSNDIKPLFVPGYGKYTKKDDNVYILNGSKLELVQDKTEDDVRYTFVDPVVEDLKQDGGHKNKSNPKSTGQRARIQGRLRTIYEGPRGGKYVKRDGRFVRI